MSPANRSPPTRQHFEHGVGAVGRAQRGRRAPNVAQHPSCRPFVQTSTTGSSWRSAAGSVVREGGGRMDDGVGPATSTPRPGANDGVGRCSRRREWGTTVEVMRIATIWVRGRTRFRQSSSTCRPRSALATVTSRLTLDLDEQSSSHLRRGGEDRFVASARRDRGLESGTRRRLLRRGAGQEDPAATSSGSLPARRRGTVRSCGARGDDRGAPGGNRSRRSPSARECCVDHRPGRRSTAAVPG